MSENNQYRFVSAEEFNQTLARIAAKKEANAEEIRKRNLEMLAAKNARKKEIAAKKAQIEATSKQVEALQARRATPGISDEERKQITREINLLNLKTSANRERCTFNLLNSKPGFKPANESVYDSIVSLKQRGYVMSHIARKLGQKEADVEIQLQFAVTQGDLTIEEMYAHRAVKRSKEDILEAMCMRNAGTPYRDIVQYFADNNITMSIEVIAHAENYI